MLEFCPLCHKNGYKRKITLRQINLEEAVYLCEYSECPWPFGYQDFTFVSRRVGETWSSEWETRKPPVLKSTEPYQVSLNELGLDTPPVTPGSGSEVIHKDLVSGDGACSVTSSSSNVNNFIQAKVSSGSSKNSSSGSRQSVSGESGSIDTEGTETTISGENHSSVRSGPIKISRDFQSRKLSNSINYGLRDKETQLEFKGDFSLSDDVNLESLDKCLLASQGFSNACDAADAATETIFNVGKSSKDNLSAHESTVKCKKWLSDNTKGRVADHCHSTPESKKVAVEFKKVFSEGLGHRLQKSSRESLNSINRRPRIKSIEKTNVKLAEVITISNQSIRAKNKAFSTIVEKTSPTVVGDVIDIVENEPEQNTNTHAIPCITVGEKTPETCKIENRTLAIEGIVPINISYEVPSFEKESTTVPWSTNCKDEVKEEIVSLDSGQQPVVNNSVISIDVKVEALDSTESKDSQLTTSSTTEIRRQSMKKPLKRAIPKVAKYQGFNFGTLKKKLKSNGEENIKSSLPNVPSPDNVSSCSDLTWSSEISCTTTTTCDSKSESVSSGTYSQSKSTLGTGNSSPAPSSSDLKSSNACSPGNYGLLESNFNLDQVLDDLMLSDNDDLTKDLGDNWLESLFN